MDIRLPQENRLVVQGLEKRFRSHVAIAAIDLVVRARELVVVLGPPGSGKTTLLRTIAGLEKPSAGVVRIDGLDATLLPPQRRDLAFAFQTPALFPHLSIEENIALPLRAQQVAKHALVRRVEELIDSFELQHVRRMKPRRLTSGERHLAGLARALVRDPQAFLMDEPLGTLEGEQRRRTRDRLSAIHHNLRATTLLATRDASDAMALADRIVIINEGRLIQFDTPSMLRDRPADAFVAKLIGSSH